MAIYVPGTEELDQKKQNMSLQAIAASRASSTDFGLVQVDGTTITSASGVITSVGGTTPGGHIFGLTLSTAGSSATFGVAIGTAASNDTTPSMMTLASAYTKTTSAWALGTGNGSLDTGAIANSTWYHVYLIMRSDTSVVDILISTSASAPTMPASYDKKRRIGSMKTNGSAQWVLFSQYGDEFLWDVSVFDINANNPGTSAVTRTLTIPLGVKVHVIIVVQADTNGATDGRVTITSLDKSDEILSNTGFYNGFNTAQYIIPTSALIRSNTSQQIRSRNSTSSATTYLYLWTLGWIDRRGRDA